MTLDPLFLSRLQFFWVIALHILLPAFTVGLAAYIAVLEGLHLTTGRSVYLRLSKFWLKVFAVSFGMGVVSGIVMPPQCMIRRQARRPDAPPRPLPRADGEGRPRPLVSGSEAQAPARVRFTADATADPPDGSTIPDSEAQVRFPLAVRRDDPGSRRRGRPLCASHRR